MQHCQTVSPECQSCESDRLEQHQKTTSKDSASVAPSFSAWALLPLLFQPLGLEKPHLLVKAVMHCCTGPLQVRLAKMPQSLGKRKRKKINYREEHGIREAAARLDSDSDPDVGAEGGYSDSVSHAWFLCTEFTVRPKIAAGHICQRLSWNGAARLAIRRMTSSSMVPTLSSECPAASPGSTEGHCAGG